MHHSILHEQRPDGVHIIRFGPDLEAGSSQGQQIVRDFFGLEFLSCTMDSHCVIVDLSPIQTLDSSSLGPLVQRLRELQDRHGRLILCGLNAPALREIFALTRFDQIFEISASVESALAALDNDEDDWPS